MIECQRCGWPVLHLRALLEHWKQHGGARGWDVYPARGGQNRYLGEFRIARPIR